MVQRAEQGPTGVALAEGPGANTRARPTAGPGRGSWRTSLFPLAPKPFAKVARQTPPAPTSNAARGWWPVGWLAAKWCGGRGPAGVKVPGESKCTASARNRALIRHASDCPTADATKRHKHATGRAKQAFLAQQPQQPFRSPKPPRLKSSPGPIPASGLCAVLFRASPRGRCQHKAIAWTGPSFWRCRAGAPWPTWRARQRSHRRRPHCGGPDVHSQRSCCRLWHYKCRCWGR